MKVAFINTYNNGSTGRIALEILETVKKNGGEAQLFYGRCLNDKQGTYTGISKSANKFIDCLVAFSGDVGHLHWKETRNLISKLEEFKPEIIHMHNLHGNYINLVKLFKYVIKNKIKVVVTVHDFYLFTGRCAYPFDCDKWVHGCGKCKFKSRYPKTLFIDKSRKLLEEKIQLLKMAKPVIVCPSLWIMNEIKKSKLSFCNCVVINNGIEMQHNFSSFIPNKNAKIILLGIASPWDERKGLEDFNYLADKLNPEKYEIRLIGLEEKNKTHSNIVRYKKMNKKYVMKQIQECDIFINPSIADTFPTTNLEVLSMGKPIIAYDISGTAEVVNEINGIKVPPHNVEALYRAIVSFDFNKFKSYNIIKDANKYSIEKMKKNYYQLFLFLLANKL